MVVGNSCPERAVRISVCVIKYCLPYNFHIVGLFCACYDIPNLAGRVFRKAGRNMVQKTRVESSEEQTATLKIFTRIRMEFWVDKWDCTYC